MSIPIGTDINMLCETVTWAAGCRYINQKTLQRHIRVGFVKAQRLMLLLEDYGITDRQLARWDPHTVLITKDDLPETLTKLREIAAKEDG